MKLKIENIQINISKEELIFSDSDLKNLFEDKVIKIPLAEMLNNPPDPKIIKSPMNKGIEFNIKEIEIEIS